MHYQAWAEQVVSKVQLLTAGFITSRTKREALISCSSVAVSNNCNTKGQATLVLLSVKNRKAVLLHRSMHAQLPVQSRVVSF
jgi:hypothetical protein